MDTPTVAKRLWLVLAATFKWFETVKEIEESKQHKRLGASEAVQACHTLTGASEFLASATACWNLCIEYMWCPNEKSDKRQSVSKAVCVWNPKLGPVVLETQLFPFATPAQRQVAVSSAA